VSDQERAILEMRAELTAVKLTLGTLIAWMSQSANSPIRMDEAKQLLEALK